YGLIAGAFSGWISGGGFGAIFVVIVCYFEPLLSGAYLLMVPAGMALGMVLGTIGGAVSGAIGGMTANPRIGLLAGIVAGVVFGIISLMNLQTPSLFGFALSCPLLGVPATLGGYEGGWRGRQLSRE